MFREPISYLLLVTYAFLDRWSDLRSFEFFSLETFSRFLKNNPTLLQKNITVDLHVFVRRAVWTPFSQEIHLYAFYELQMTVPTCGGRFWRRHSFRWVWGSPFVKKCHFTESRFEKCTSHSAPSHDYQGGRRGQVSGSGATGHRWACNEEEKTTLWCPKGCFVLVFENRFSTMFLFVKLVELWEQGSTW